MAWKDHLPPLDRHTVADLVALAALCYIVGLLLLLAWAELTREEEAITFPPATPSLSKGAL